MVVIIFVVVIVLLAREFRGEQNIVNWGDDRGEMLVEGEGAKEGLGISDFVKDSAASFV